MHAFTLAALAAPTLRFALWPVIDGQPHPEASDPWGETHAADCLTGYHDGDLGPHLTVTASTDGETCRVVFAGDASAALVAYAARVAEETGHPAFEGPAIEQARRAYEIAAEHTADEWGREACMDWCEPDPNTSRSFSRMPDSVRQNIRSGALAQADGIEAARFDSFLCEALGITAEPVPLRLAA